MMTFLFIPVISRQMLPLLGLIDWRSACCILRLKLSIKAEKNENCYMTDDLSEQPAEFPEEMLLGVF